MCHKHERAHERWIAAAMGPTKVRYAQGPLRREGRIVEKALDGYFDQTRDYACGLLEVFDLRCALKLLAALEAAPELEIMRVKNRFDSGYDVDDSAGYRD